MKSKAAVFIICGVYNNLKDTKLLLKCIESQTYTNIQTIIIDDGSTDDTDKYIKNNYPKTVVLKGDGNLWWTGSIYLGVEYALKRAKSRDYVFTINNDCTFGKNYLKTITEVSEKQQRAIVGSLIIDEAKKDAIIDAGVYRDWKRAKFNVLGSKKVSKLPKNKNIEKNINVLSTKGTLFPVEVFAQIGNFNKKDLPHYLSDYEFSHRAKVAGFQLLLSYRVKVFNKSQRTGIGKRIKSNLSYKEIIQLLFSRRSRINIIDHLSFIRLCCPLRYKMQNYFVVLLKSVYLISYAFPFNILKSLKMHFGKKL